MKSPPGKGRPPDAGLSGDWHAADRGEKPASIRVSHAGDIRTAMQCARDAAHAAGFPHTVAEEIALAARELATNLIKHAVWGHIRVVRMGDGDGSCIRIESTDNGPGIADVDQAMADGFSTGGGLGYGLGTVQRLMDDIAIDSGYPDRGTRIVCSRRKPVARVRFASPLEVGAATRPHARMVANGDAFVVKTGPSSILVAVIDGLGHGQPAHRASQKARAYIERHADLPLEKIFANIERECRPTRGVVMALARFDHGEERDGTRIRMTFAGIGNIEARVLESAEPVRFVTRRGIVGKNAPKPLLEQHPWIPNAILVMHSDGVSTHWKWADFRHCARRSAAAAARELLYALGKEHDDATVVVVKWKDRTKTYDHTP